jgi:hypothetical protein
MRNHKKVWLGNWKSYFVMPKEILPYSMTRGTQKKLTQGLSDKHFFSNVTNQSFVNLVKLWLVTKEPVLSI